MKRVWSTIVAILVCVGIFGGALALANGRTAPPTEEDVEIETPNGAGGNSSTGSG